MLCDLYVLDKYRRSIHRIGDGTHDSISSDIHNEVHYVNMQNGDGGGVDDVDGYGYVILKSDSGFLCNEYGIIDKRYIVEIKEYLVKRGYDISDMDENGNYIRKER